MWRVLLSAYCAEEAQRHREQVTVQGCTASEHWRRDLNPLSLCSSLWGSKTMWLMKALVTEDPEWCCAWCDAYYEFEDHLTLSWSPREQGAGKGALIWSWGVGEKGLVLSGVLISRR